MRMTLIALALATTPAAAEAPMSAAEFEAYVTGKTLTYAENGSIYGIEEYLPDRRVRWAFSKDECQDGYWYEASKMICFVYEENPDPQCWTFWKEPTGLRARYENFPDATELYEARKTTEPLKCLGPDVGV